MIHEITHAWQSQHANDPTAYIKTVIQSKNYIINQNIPEVCLYIYIPGSPFKMYGAEQIAMMVQHYYLMSTQPIDSKFLIDTDGDGKKDTNITQADLQPIIEVIRSAQKNQPVTDNIEGLSTPKVGCL